MVAYLTALILTLGVEVPLVPLAVEGTWNDEEPAPLGLSVGVALAANLMTHGTLWSVFYAVPLSYWPKVFLLEALVTVTEGFAYWWFGLFKDWTDALAVALILNFTTTAIGLLAYAL